MKRIYSYDHLLAWWEARKRKLPKSVYTNRFTVARSVIGFIITEYSRPICSLGQDNVLSWQCAQDPTHAMKRTAALFGLSVERIAPSRYILGTGASFAEFYRGLKLDLTTKAFHNTLPPLRKRGDPEHRKSYLAKKRAWVADIRARIAFGITEGYAAQMRADRRAFAETCKFDGDDNLFRLSSDYYLAQYLNECVFKHDISDVALRRLTLAILNRTFVDTKDIRHMSVFNAMLRGLSYRMHMDAELYEVNP